MNSANSAPSPMGQVPPAPGKGVRVAVLITRIAVLLLSLFIFLVCIKLLSGSFKEIGIGSANGMIEKMTAVAALAVGVLATVLVQSSSVTTSLIVSAAGVGLGTGQVRVEDIAPFVPMIMGANVGTTITNTLAAMGSVTRSQEFERAFGGALIHDFFNLLSVAILLPLELTTQFLSKSAVWITNQLSGFDGTQISESRINFIKDSVKSVTKLAKSGLHGIGLEGTPYIVCAVIVAVAGIFLCLYFITKNMKHLMANRLEGIINAALEKRGSLGIFVGLLVTFAVQSSSITTSILVPMFGAGVLSHRSGFPIMLGANLGTTITAFMAALVKGPIGLALAIVHLLFNICGILLFYPIPALRDVPIKLAQGLAKRTMVTKWWILLYVGGVFVVLPLLALLVFKS